ncbi:TIGR03943 family putative permease subunit [Metabacillus sp. YM-086]|uniref:TIGR03943 family putative permease subunit n=1 Tax=Metabacillus TaxID=2675233 RepID=UPI000EF601C9|nr:TIGR03943 family protein [Metabacillus litoralis]MCM3411802.1 TIGR03943 family protein [Metabacillus litoralis]
MTLQKRQAIKAIILLLFASFIFILHQSGDMKHFIHPNYLHFSQFASVIFLILFFFQVPRIFRPLEAEYDHSLCGPWGCQHEEEGSSLKMILSIGIISIPLLTGFMMPYRTFGAEEALKRGIQYSGLDHQLSSGIELANGHIKSLMTQPLIRLDHTGFTEYIGMISEYPEVFEGKEIEIEGFIAEDQFMSKREKVIARFQVTHCVADAHASGFILENSDEFDLMNNTWVRIKGTLKVKEENQQYIPVINVKAVENIDTPQNPYIFS